LGNGHSLKALAEEARSENVTMRRLTEKATQDAAAVKVLTIMTLVYLPATVVSVGSAEVLLLEMLNGFRTFSRRNLSIRSQQRINPYDLLLPPTGGSSWPYPFL
jgi:hypothetical protein